MWRHHLSLAASLVAVRKMRTASCCALFYPAAAARTPHKGLGGIKSWFDPMEPIERIEQSAN